MSNAREAAAVAVGAWIRADQRDGIELDLARYLRTYPGAEIDVARVFQQLTREPIAEPRADTETDSSSVNTIGRFELKRVLGRGGHAIVWLAYDSRLDRDVALKVATFVEDADSNDRASRERFEREAQVAAEFEHPAFCPVYDVGSDAGRAWLAIRHVEGPTLDVWANTRRGTPDFVERALGICAKVAHGLAAAHAAGIVHCDVKPANVIVADHDQPCILDLGVAQLSEDAREQALTATTVGSPAYLAPEVLTGVPSGATAQRDIWALGVSVYEVLAGHRPFHAPTIEGLTRAILMDEPDLLRGWSRDLRVVLQTVLSKETGRRYKCASDFAEELLRLQRREPVLARPLGAPTRTLRWMRRRPAIAGTLMALVLGLATATIVSRSQLSATRRAVARNQVLLEEITGVSDSKVGRLRLAEVRDLWPIHPTLVPRQEAWIADVRGVLERVDRHRLLRMKFTARMHEQGGQGGTSDHRNRWLVEQVESLIAMHPELETALVEVERRNESSRTLRKTTVEDEAASWEVAAAAVRADPRFAGFDLVPQVGLIPMGPDPKSGLQEFALATTGITPTRDGPSRRIIIDLPNAMVFVLLPGGHVRLGAEQPGPGGKLGDARIDPGVDRYESGILECELEPFFVAKYEFTRGIWMDHEGVDPSSPRVDGGLRVLPVDQVTWDQCHRVLTELGLAIPSEAQWEHAARGGTDTVWYTGDSVESLNGHANLADRTAQKHSQSRGNFEGSYEEWLEDGMILTTHVGRFGANPFGLHDIVGNVSEWTTGGYSWPGDKKPSRERGDRVGEPQMFVAKGSNWRELAQAGRMAARVGFSRESRLGRVGVRAVRPLDLSSEARGQ